MKSAETDAICRLLDVFVTPGQGYKSVWLVMSGCNPDLHSYRKLHQLTAADAMHPRQVRCIAYDVCRALRFLVRP